MDTVRKIGNSGIELVLCAKGETLHEAWDNLSATAPTSHATHKAMAAYFIHKNGNGRTTSACPGCQYQKAAK